MNISSPSFMPRQVPGSELVFPDQEIVRLKAKEIGLSWISSREYVQQLSDISLKRLFGKLYKGPREKFTEYYDINFNVFNKYMKVGNSLVSREAIQRWLLHSANLSDQIKETLDVNNQHVRADFLEIADLINAVKAQISFVCYLDGDNYPQALEQLIGIEGIYLVCYKLKGSHSRLMDLWKDSHFFSIRYTHTWEKDSADVLMTMDTSLLHLNLPLELSFFVISADHFTCELVAGLQHLGRSCQRVDPRIRNLRVYFNLLNEPEIWVHAMTENADALAHRLKDAVVYSKDLPSFRDPSQHIFWTGNVEFLHLVETIDILDLVVELFHVGLPAPSYDGKGNQLDLRIRWRMTWGGSVKQFAARYNLTINQVYQYLRYQQDPDVENAMHKYLSHNYITKF